MLCLGIESSCDETALALVRDGKLLGQVLRSQVDLHALFGGVVPELASREHGRTIGPLFDLLLERCAIQAKEIDLIAVARGPGLLGSLLVGVAFAKGLAVTLQKPIIGINHLQAHLLAAGLEQELVFPAIGLLASGGHTHLYRIKSVLDFELLGRTLDDAAGEALDKFGKMIGLPYPAGRHIDEFGAKGELDVKMFSKPYLDNDNLNFSFSGLKTAALNKISERKDLRFNWMPGESVPLLPAGETGVELASLCASFAHTVAETLQIKTRRALSFEKDTKALILAGGVAANSRVRYLFAELAKEFKLRFIVPGAMLCTDNAAMIAYAGWLFFKFGLRHELSFSAIPRGRIVPDDYTTI